MARHPLSSFVTLWNRHKLLYSEVFSSALLKLSEMDRITGDEDAISERLSLILKRICYNYGKSRNQEVQTPYWEAPIQPVSENELKGGKTRNRPDFTCRCVNPWADSPEEHEISLHVECKRLGNPTSATWILNENYVKNGIKRFDSRTHEYGKRAFSGMMVGYIISMTPKRIETEVNDYQKKHLPQNTKIKFRFDATSLFQTRQTIKRKIVKPDQLELIHFWVDLRKCYQP